MSVSIWIVIGVYAAASVALGLTDKDCRGALLMMLLLPLVPVLLVGTWLNRKAVDTYTVDPDDASGSIKAWLGRRRNKVRILALSPRLIILVGSQKNADSS